MIPGNAIRSLRCSFQPGGRQSGRTEEQEEAINRLSLARSTPQNGSKGMRQQARHPDGTSYFCLYCALQPVRQGSHLRVIMFAVAVIADLIKQ